MMNNSRWIALIAAVVVACRAERSSDRATIADQPRDSAAAGDDVGAPPPTLAVRHAASPAADTIALDSCARLDTLARAQGRVIGPGEALPSPRAGSWSDTRVGATPLFTIELPAAANGFSLTPGGGFYADSFPGCRFSCILRVELRRDSLHEGASGYVERMRREEDAEWSPGPSRRLTVDGRPAVLVETPCGDCNSASVYLARGDTLAEIGFSVDDREGYQPGIACRLARVAQSFQWP